jgi:hypothetical protein
VAQNTPGRKGSLVKEYERVQKKELISHDTVMLKQKA